MISKLLVVFAFCSARGRQRLVAVAPDHQLRQHPGRSPKAEMVITIPKGMGPHGIGEKLVKAGVIDSERLFYWNVRFIRGIQTS